MKPKEYEELVEKWRCEDLKYLQERTNEGAKRVEDNIRTLENENSWTCKECGETIIGFKIAFSIHDGPFPHSGSGRCKYIIRPYCPKCDKIEGTPGFPEIPSLGYKFSYGCIDY